MVPVVDLIWCILGSCAATLIVHFAWNTLVSARREANRPTSDALLSLAKSAELTLSPGSYELVRETGSLRLTVESSIAGSAWQGRVAFHLATHATIAYLAGLALLPGARFFDVFRFVVIAAFVGFGSTWLHQGLATTGRARSTWHAGVDAIACSVVAGVLFGLLWPPR